MRILASGLGAALCIAASATASFGEILAYTTATSYAPGDTIHVCVSSPAPSIQAWIGRTGVTESVLWSGIVDDQRVQAVPDSSFALGCRWDVTLSVPTGSDWPTGAYFVRFRDPDSSAYPHVAFTIRPSRDAPRSRVIYVRSVSTSEAYNEFGGASYYRGALGIKTSIVSFDRPNPGIRWGGTLSHPERPVLRMVEEYGGDVIDSVDLHRDPTWLDGADVLVTAYHDEYVSRPVYDAYEAFRNRGGGILFLAANNIYWQIRYSEDLRQQICYKSSTADPWLATHPELVTGRWTLWPLNRPESALVGISYGNWFTTSIPRRSLPAAVADAEHWSWIGTGVTAGQLVGFSPAEDYIGGEWDHVDAWSPANLDMLLETTIPMSMHGVPRAEDTLHQATYYETTPHYGFEGSSFARVFASGSNSMGRVLFVDEEVTRLVDNLMRACLDSTTTALTLGLGANVATSAVGLVAGDELLPDQDWSAGAAYGFEGGTVDHSTVEEGWRGFSRESLSVGRKGLEMLHVTSDVEHVLVTLIYTIDARESEELTVTVFAEGERILAEEVLTPPHVDVPVRVLRMVVPVTDGVLDLNFKGTHPDARLVAAEFRGVWPDRREPEVANPRLLAMSRGGFEIVLDEPSPRSGHRMMIRWLDALNRVVSERAVSRVVPTRLRIGAAPAGAARVSIQDTDVFGNVSPWSEPLDLPEVTAVEPGGEHGSMVSDLRVLRSGTSRVQFAFRSPGSGTSLSIYDTAGRLVCRRQFAEPRGDSVDWDWDGVDRSHRAVTRGAYFARLEHEGEVVARKFVLQ